MLDENTLRDLIEKAQKGDTLADKEATLLLTPTVMDLIQDIGCPMYLDLVTRIAATKITHDWMMKYPAGSLTPPSAWICMNASPEVEAYIDDHRIRRRMY